MILVYPHNADWNHIARPDRRPVVARRAHARRTSSGIENCHHRPDRVARQARPSIRRRHGWHGWLQTEKADPASRARRSRTSCEVLLESAHAALDDARRAARARAVRCFESQVDPNDWRLVRDNADRRPLHAADHAQPRADRHARARARRRAKHPDRLKIELDALATRVLFDDANRAIGVEYLKGERLYRRPRAGRAQRRAATAPGAAPRESHPRGRRVQHAAAPDALGHRAARDARAARHPGARRPARASARTCRTATRSASSTG